MKVPFHVYFFRVFNFIALTVTFLFIFGVVRSKPTYFAVANTVVKSILALWLLYRFGYLKETSISRFDRHAALVVGGYILIVNFADIIQYFRLQWQNKILSLLK